ncbi:MAG: class I SAM-dependent methyltransferase [Planctomycetota bacterium]|jgi:tRNA (cmo5U34)-methyltransferase
MANTVENFYDDISNDYTASVERCVPRYREMLSMLFTYLPKEYSPESLLELGCGTGNLTHLISNYFPQTRIHAVDISEECIKECKKRLPNANIEFIKSDFRDLDFLENSFDLVISSISLHHINDEEKEVLFRRLFRWQTPKSILTFCDQFKGETHHLYNQHMETWKTFAFTQGTTDKEWDMWMNHQNQHDFHAPMLNHVNWLKDAGYSVADCTWRYLLWAVIYAEKGLI